MLTSCVHFNLGHSNYASAWLLSNHLRIDDTLKYHIVPRPVQNI